MTFPDINVNITAEAVIGSVCVGDLCQKWPWVSCQRMKGDAVKNDGRTLKGQQGHLESFGILAQEPLHTPKISDRQTSPQI